MHCYVINLPSAEKRRNRTEKELATYLPKVRWSIPEMYVAAEMSNEQFAALYDSEGARKFHNRDMSRGEIACALSHQSALKDFLTTEDECCMIVEDDVLFSPVMQEFTDKLEQWMVERKKLPISVVLSEAAVVRYWSSRKWFCGVRRTHPIRIYGAIAYVVNRNGAELILNANRPPIKMMSDQWHYYAKHGLHVFGVDKFLAGSFDFDRKDSSLSSGRAEAFKKSIQLGIGKDIERSFIDRIIPRLQIIWWICTGAKRGGDRCNVGLYKNSDRIGGAVK